MLARRAGLTADWPQRYFSECQAAIEADLEVALAADMKHMTATRNLPQLIAQMTVWDAQGLLQRHHAAIEQWLAAQGDDWLLNAISIRERKSYWLAGPLPSQQKLSLLLTVHWQGAHAVLGRAMQRKELLKLALAAASPDLTVRGKAVCC